MTDESALLAAEDELWRANREGDGGFYAKNLRDDALVVSKYGVASKEIIVATIGANRNPYVKTVLSDQRVLFITSDSALVTYKADVTALVAGKEVEFSVLASTVYARENDQWRGVLHQQSAL
ncbi:nuclear transport factor 2 family protein [Fodinicola feengrottensis]|uniref:DUF4440 domain-containing protein n=1 Tax=Fodinicola feengrottensis TaxID=435914 RepID=A0ABP4UQD8_9ACTN|nr:nuclear transport factor 2 family protein [Fodinicola feengrottensis]